MKAASITRTVGIGAALAGLTTPALAEARPGANAKQTRLEFQLPLPGESIPTEGGGLLVEADTTIRQVLFHWQGPDTGSAEGSVQVEGFFQAHTPALKPGKWILEAQGFDAEGKLLARRSQSFEVGETRGPGQGEVAVSTARVVQGLYLAANLGTKFGVAENNLESYRSIKLAPDGASVPGPAIDPYDRILSGDASMVYHLQQGDFRLKVRTSTDLSETWGHSQSPSRFGADLYWKDWGEAHLGDQYPAWSQLLMDGSRIRGEGIGLVLRNEGETQARADFAIGKLRPAIDPQIRTWDGAIDTLPAQFGRAVQIGHLGFGDGTPLGLNLTVAHVKDMTTDVDLALHDSLSGATPHENFAIGTDLVSRLWTNRVEFYFNSAFGITTDDTRQGSILDSLRNKKGLPLPGFLDDITTINLTTHGVELFTQGTPGTVDFLWENLALRTGVRLLIPMGDVGRLRLDSRWVHFGTEYQSLARGFQESPRTGLEWSATTALARDALLIVMSGSEVESRPDLATTLPTHTVNMNLAWTPVAAPFGWHAESGTLNSGGGDATRTESWNGGGGLFGTVKTTTQGSIFWRTGYGYYQSALRIPITSMDTSNGLGFASAPRRSEVRTHSLDGSMRWRPFRDLEWRTGYTLASQGFPGDTIQTQQTQTHRFLAGVSSWQLGHQLELALDASLVYRPEQPGSDATGWDQTARVNWNLADSKTLHFTQRWARLAGGRNDIRFDAGWEAWY